MTQGLIQNDVRPIMALDMAGEEGTTWHVGHIGITRIEPYPEDDVATICWFAVYRGEWLAHRVNAALVEDVWYGEAPETKEKTNVNEDTLD